MATNRQLRAKFAYFASVVFLFAFEAPQATGYENGSVAVLAAGDLAYPHGGEKSICFDRFRTKLKPCEAPPETPTGYRSGQYPQDPD